jgi:hypothetical protein
MGREEVHFFQKEAGEPMIPRHIHPTGMSLKLKGAFSALSQSRKKDDA